MPEAVAAPLSETQRAAWRDDGYLVVRRAYGRDRARGMSAAIGGMVERAAAGELAPFRWLDRERLLPAVINDLLTPEKYDTVFGGWLDAVVIPAIEQLLDSPVRASWLALFTCGSGIPYSTPWHRDNCEIGNPNELAVLSRDSARQCSIQAPLQPGDRFLQVVPGSHRRAPTAGELAAYRGNPDGKLPGEVTVELEPGDIVFRHANTLHRGLNREGRPRWTLISSFWAERTPIWTIEQQDYAALATAGHSARMPPRLRASVERFLRASERQGAARPVMEA